MTKGLAPATRGLRERKREATHNAIVDAAMELFDQRGYDRVTVDEIADAADVSPRTFFRYFGSKEEVLFAESDRRRRLLLDAIAAEPDDLPLFDAIARACRSVADHYADDRERLRTRRTIIDRSPSLHQRDAELPRRWDHDVVDAMRESGRAGDLDRFELRLLVGASMNALRVALAMWIDDDGHDDLGQLIDRAFERLADGFA